MDKITVNDIINHLEEYRWHNLINNPEDLPDIDEDVIIWYTAKKKEDADLFEDGAAITSYGDVSFWTDVIINDWRTPWQYFNTNHKIIAWHRIEPFYYKGESNE